MRAVRVRFNTGWQLLLAITLGCAVLAGGSKQAQLKDDLESIHPIPAAKAGADLYMQYCAVCHGNDLKGSGRVPVSYRMPPDLARRHGGKFPEALVSEVLRNGAVLPAHGPAEMPVWGDKFRATDRLDASQVKARIRDLTDYIKARQAR
jgi:mono/diheme cytochrome c family protein